jgi:hypothetical protein
VTRKSSLVLSSGLMLISLLAEAQEVSQHDLAACAAKTSAAEKLACYEALTIIPDPAPAEPGAKSLETPDSPVVEAEQPAPAPAIVTGGAAVELHEMPEQAVFDAESAAPSPAAVANETHSTAPEDLGEEHLLQEGKPVKADPFPVTAIVREVTQSRSGRLYFHFSNGQVWRQNEARRFRYPRDQEFEVTISKGMMGDYRLRVDEDGPMTRIRRVE